MTSAVGEKNFWGKRQVAVGGRTLTDGEDNDCSGQPRGAACVDHHDHRDVCRRIAEASRHVAMKAVGVFGAGGL